MRALDDTELHALLDDDAPCGDLTTDALGIGRQAARLEFRARQAMTVCGSEEAARMFEMAGGQTRLIARSGTNIGAGELILEVEGWAEALHRAVR